MKKNLLIMLLCFFIPTLLSGCDTIYGVLQKEGAEEKEILGDVIPFDDNEQVKEVQRLLKLNGYNVGSIDGKLGATTRNAIEKFQTERGLDPNRFVDKNTWEELKYLERKGLFTDDEINILTVQTALNRAGFEVGKIDGKYGPKTKKALQNFQEKHNLKVDGIIGPKTLLNLSQYLDENLP